MKEFKLKILIISLIMLSLFFILFFTINFENKIIGDVIKVDDNYYVVTKEQLINTKLDIIANKQRTIGYFIFSHVENGSYFYKINSSIIDNLSKIYIINGTCKIYDFLESIF